jgi:DNA-binding transcriptional ArsR family regulator
MERTNDPGEGETDISALLEEVRRRYLLYCLYMYANPVRLSDIAYQIAIWEGEEAVDDIAAERHRVYMSLYHDHLPELADADIVEYDQQEDMVELGANHSEVKDALEQQLSAEIDTLLDAEHTTFDETTPPAASGDLHRALAAPERRQLLAHLCDNPEISLDEATTVLVGWRATEEGTVRPEEREQIQNALHHVHVPLLSERGLITYDEESETIALSSLSDPVRETIRTATRYNRLTRADQSDEDTETIDSAEWTG